MFSRVIAKSGVRVVVARHVTAVRSFATTTTPLLSTSAFNTTSSGSCCAVRLLSSSSSSSTITASPFSSASRQFSSSAAGTHRYVSTHEWISTEGVVGISDFAQSELGEVVYVDLPEVGATLKAGESFGSVESVKAASTIYSPVDGVVVAINSAVVDAPELVNSSPEGEGWMIKIEVSDPSQVAALQDATSYVAEFPVVAH
jgi:glycine cleavage system H protein